MLSLQIDSSGPALQNLFAMLSAAGWVHWIYFVSKQGCPVESCSKVLASAGQKAKEGSN